MAQITELEWIQEDDGVWVAYDHKNNLTWIIERDSSDGPTKIVMYKLYFQAMIANTDDMHEQRLGEFIMLRLAKRHAERKRKDYVQ